ncbi:polycomb group protein EMBRYONIC FLOWER 2-like isoform X3 [Cynara cardunculus var. scolymus]|uniref:polycomb group protein EMBRYONIC FLOWER 2-like isoform X3 n=1 Tax=Cynara cardunculus var. scolymus TaxID=59895 RepID=UPI000D62E37D|nr:polycomb group protein EMBRYONIC FLOWER 2-like isoform X3 [Cynara cardunculus var. scolymus]
MDVIIVRTVIISSHLFVVHSVLCLMDSCNRIYVCVCSYSRDSDQMCRQEPRVHLSEEEQTAAEESLSVYCKPVELYNILQRRAIKNPSFLQRCLHYKLQEKYKRRVQVSISISGAIGGLQTQSLFPLYILLARPVSTPNGETQRSSVYRFKRACKLTSFNGAQSVRSARAKFILPEINKLSTEVKSGSLAMLLVSCADITNPKEIDLTKDHMFSPASNIGGYCLLGKIPMDFLHLSWENSPNLSLGERVELMSTVSMQSCYMKLSCSDEEKCVSFQFPYNSEAVSILQQVPVMISAEELGAKDISPYDLYSYNNIPPNSLPHVIRLRAANVIFNYKYYNNMLQRSEVTEDYSCPFCLMKCASYKGLRLHLVSSHDLFRYEFWVNEDYQVVIVSVKTDTCNSEIFGNIVDPRQQSLFFCHKPLGRKEPGNRTPNALDVHPLVLDPDMTATISDLRGVSERVERDIRSPNATCPSSATGVSFAGQESAAQSIPASNLAPPALLQFAKTRKLSVERSDPRNQVLLQKRQFFHSHRAQPMALEQVYAEQDSEDEVDDDVADLEDRRMLDDFVDVTQDEKQMMHLWNSFVRKQRVLADAHIAWACEAFSNLHGKDLVRTPQLHWCWRLFMVKLWNHGLLDPKTMNKCHLMLDKYEHQYRTPNT